MSRGHQSKQVQGLKNAEPELPGEHTKSEDVLGYLILLIAKRAVCWVWESPFLKAISCPTAVVNSKPYEDLAFVRSPTFPQLFPWFKVDGANKECSIG
jgi:hypothetical protein